MNEAIALLFGLIAGIAVGFLIRDVLNETTL